MSDTSFSHLVVVGSSAGGIDALSKLVSTLPEDFAAPIVIAQHLSPRHESHLQEILSRRSTLPVKTVTDHAPLEAGVVFVVPANRHVNITDAEIGLSQDRQRGPMPSIDLLLSSAAGVYGEDLISVILTGTGTDGVDGARAVRRAGGTVIIQNPETAEFGGLPSALAPSTVDIVIDLEKVGPVLEKLLSGEEVAEREVRTEEQRSLQRFLEDLRERHGVDFTKYKTPTILRRLKRRMAATDTETIQDYEQHLQERPEEYRQLVNTFLIKVTEFFRNPELFAHLKEEVLPELVEEARQENRQLRIWSAGCATGEEAYTLAIILSELLGDEAGYFDVRIFATDVDEGAVDFARQGIYPPSALGNLSEDQVERYFEGSDGQYQVRKQVRSMIVFGEHDLARRSPFPRVDLVLSRNVLIYFTPELQRRSLQLFAYSLRDGGYLVLGKAETVSPLGEFFEPQHRHHKVYRRRGERFLIPPSIPMSHTPVPRVRPDGGRRTPRSHTRPEPQFEMWRTRVAEEGLLGQLPVGVVLVNRRYDIQTINLAARRLLSIPGAAVGEDLLHLLQNVPYTEVRRSIDTALRDGEDSFTGEIAVEDVAAGETGYLHMICHPLRSEGERGPAETVAIVIHEVTEAARARRSLERELETTNAKLARFRREAEEETARQREQNERLLEANRRLEGANRELTRINQDLQFTNEELEISAEEAQAATEEVETLNEELQATNEELETLNEELQATVEELNTTNDDLQARPAELQDMARSSERERRESEAARQQLEAILRGISDAVLAVDARGAALFTNAVFDETFGDDPAPLSEGGEPLTQDQTPRFRAARGESFVMRFVIEEPGTAPRRFEVRGHPVDGDAGGGVLVIREVPEGGTDG
jgi:two-component system CheB/CheR fusion protein